MRSSTSSAQRPRESVRDELLFRGGRIDERPGVRSWRGAQTLGPDEGLDDRSFVRIITRHSRSMLRRGGADATSQTRTGEIFRWTAWALWYRARP